MTIKHAVWVAASLSVLGSVSGFQGGFAAPIVQDQQADQKKQAGTPSKDQDKADKDKKTAGQKAEDVQSSDRKTLLSLQPEMRLKLQQGPGVGKPRSILPQPFLPKGSLVIPVMPQGESKGGSKADMTGQNNQGQKNQNAAQADNINQQITDQKASDQQQVPAQQKQNAVQDGSLFSDVQIQSGLLNALDPSGVDLQAGGIEEEKQSLLPAGVSADFWQDMSRQDMLDFYQHFSKTGGSPAVADFAHQLILSAIPVPKPQATINNDTVSSNKEILDFLSARMSFLIQRGDMNGAARLLDRLPVAQNWSVFDEEKTKIALAQDKRAEACSIAESRVGSSRDVYWLRLLTFCKALEKKRDTVDFQISVLEELGQMTPAFYKLVDHILIEAETGVAADRAPAVTSAMAVQLLEATMVNIARGKVTELDLTNIDPLAIPVVLKTPGISEQAKLPLLEKAVKEGLISAENFADYILRLTPSDIDKAKARAAVAADQTALMAHRGADEISNQPNQKQNQLQNQTQNLTGQQDTAQSASSFDLDVTLAHLAAIEKDPLIRLQMLQSAWNRAIKGGYTQYVAPAYARLMADLPVTGELVDQTTTESALMIRLALLAGHDALAHKWFLTLRQTEAGKKPAADRQLISIYPLMLVAGLKGENGLSQPVAAQWWQQQSVNPLWQARKFERGNLLATVLEALAIPVSETLWHSLSAGPVTLQTQAASPAQWRGLLLAAAQNDRRKVLTQSTGLVANVGINKVPVALSGSLLGTMQTQGFDQISRRLAREILILNGL